jgi:hypothetical protein
MPRSAALSNDLVLKQVPKTKLLPSRDALGVQLISDITIFCCGIFCAAKLIGKKYYRK